MANEINVGGVITAFKASIMSSSISRAISGLLRNWTGTTYVQDSMLVTVAELAIPMGLVTLPHWAFFLNMDPTNYIQIYDATGQVAHSFIQLLPGDFAVVPMTTALTAPFAKANTAPCQLEYLILSQ